MLLARRTVGRLGVVRAPESHSAGTGGAGDARWRPTASPVIMTPATFPHERRHLTMRPATQFLALLAFTALAATIGGSPGAAAPAADTKPVRALLVIGGCCHDYKKQQELLTKGISGRANVQCAVAYDTDTTTKHLNPVYAKEQWAKGSDWNVQ